MGPRMGVPGRRSASRLAALDGTPAGSGDEDDVLPPPPAVPEVRGLSVHEMHRNVMAWSAEMDAWTSAVERHEARAKARKKTGAPSQRSPALPPLACLAAEWPPVSDSTLPEAGAARTAAAEATAAAAVAFAGAAVGHEAAAEAAYAAAATQPAAALAVAGEEWMRAGAAWRKAFEALEAAQRAQPGAGVVEEAAAEVEAARRFKRQLRGLRGRVAENPS